MAQVNTRLTGPHPHVGPEFSLSTDVQPRLFHVAYHPRTVRPVAGRRRRPAELDLGTVTRSAKAAPWRSA